MPVPAATPPLLYFADIVALFRVSGKIRQRSKRLLQRDGRGNRVAECCAPFSDTRMIAPMANQDDENGQGNLEAMLPGAPVDPRRPIDMSRSDYLGSAPGDHTRIAMEAIGVLPRRRRNAVRLTIIAVGVAALGGAILLLLALG